MIIIFGLRVVDKVAEFVLGKDYHCVVDKDREEPFEELGVQGLEGELGEGTYHVFDAQVLPKKDREDRG